MDRFAPPSRELDDDGLLDLEEAEQFRRRITGYSAATSARCSLDTA